MLDGAEMSEKKLMYYVGKRTTEKGKLVDAFTKEPKSSAQFTYYPKAKASSFAGASIGKQYDMSKGIPVLWSGAETGEAVTDETKLAWKASSRAEQAFKQQKAVDPSPELSKAIETIRLAMFNHGRAQKMAFLAWLINQLS